MARDEIIVYWSDWLDWEADDDIWRLSGVLYLYANDSQLFYIGETYSGDPWLRLKDHERDGVIDCALNASGGTFAAKVGRLALPDGRNMSDKLRFDIQTLLIRKESSKGLCNRQNTKSRGDVREGMVILNEGYYRPLARRYVDGGI